jgi:hypothetical protein
MRARRLSLRVFLALLASYLFAGPDGRYSGTWTSMANTESGKVTMTIAPIADGVWPTDFSFTFQNQPVKPTKVTTKVEQDQIEIACEELLGGYNLQTKFTGTLKGGVMEGKYRTVAEDGSQVDNGTWKLTQQ